MDELRLYHVDEAMTDAGPDRLTAAAAVWCAYMQRCLCLLCQQPLRGELAYVAIYQPEDGCLPPHSAAICRGCGAQSREQIEKSVVEMTLLHLGEGGHA